MANLKIEKMVEDLTAICKHEEAALETIKDIIADLQQQQDQNTMMIKVDVFEKICQDLEQHYNTEKGISAIERDGQIYFSIKYPRYGFFNTSNLRITYAEILGADEFNKLIRFVLEKHLGSWWNIKNIGIKTTLDSFEQPILIVDLFSISLIGVLA